MAEKKKLGREKGCLPKCGKLMYKKGNVFAVSQKLSVKGIFTELKHKTDAMVRIFYMNNRIKYNSISWPL